MRKCSAPAWACEGLGKHQGLPLYSLLWGRALQLLNGLLVRVADVSKRQKKDKHERKTEKVSFTP